MGRDVFAFRVGEVHLAGMGAPTKIDVVKVGVGFGWGDAIRKRL